MSKAEKLLERARESKLILSKLLSEVERGSDLGVEILRSISYDKGHVIGFTGPPGVGKSTVITQVVSELRKKGERVGIIAVDPSSPFTGGSILGDRIRMKELTSDEGIFIRSLSSGYGTVGITAGKMVRVLTHLEMRVIVESVGAGQLDTDIMRVADTRTVILMPELGDDIQMIKAGILEIGDIYVVNKADLPNADVMAQRLSLSLKERDGWNPPVILSSAIQGKGIEELVRYIMKHETYLRKSGIFERRRKEALVMELEEMAVESFRKEIRRLLIEKKGREIIEKVFNGEINVISALEYLEDVS